MKFGFMVPRETDFADGADPYERIYEMCQEAEELGFDFATKSGMSICMDHMVIPQKKKELLDSAYKEVEKVIDQYQEGLITDGERYNKIVDIWAGVADAVTDEMMKGIGFETMTDPETGKSSVAI